MVEIRFPQPTVGGSSPLRSAVGRFSSFDFSKFGKYVKTEKKKKRRRRGIVKGISFKKLIFTPSGRAGTSLWKYSALRSTRVDSDQNRIFRTDALLWAERHPRNGNIPELIQNQEQSLSPRGWFLWSFLGSARKTGRRFGSVHCSLRSQSPCWCSLEGRMERHDYDRETFVRLEERSPICRVRCVGFLLREQAYVSQQYHYFRPGCWDVFRPQRFRHPWKHGRRSALGLFQSSAALRVHDLRGHRRAEVSIRLSGYVSRQRMGSAQSDESRRSLRCTLMAREAIAYRRGGVKSSTSKVACKEE